MDEEFYRKQIQIIEYQMKQIERDGLDALNDIDKPRGVEWAINKLKEQIKIMEDKIKEDEKAKI